MHLLNPLVKLIVPMVVPWVESQEAMILRRGRALTPAQRAAAKKVGVKHPEKIRVLSVKRVPPPEGFLLGSVAKLAGACGDDVAGATYGYGVLIRKDCTDYRQNRELFLHEFTHVGQIERYGSIESFLLDYFHECLVDGYGKGKLEKQADRRAAEFVRFG